jgi:hypothetical protein
MKPWKRKRVKDSPTKVVLHPNPKMLLQIAIEPEILQV